MNPVKGSRGRGGSRSPSLRRRPASPPPFDLEPVLPSTPRRSRTAHALSLLLTTALAAGALTGCALVESVAADCEGTDARVRELAALGVLESRPAGATVPRGFEKADAGCWADSGDVVLYADRTYVFSGTKEAVAAHYRTAAPRDGWTPSSDPRPGDLCFTRDGTTLAVVLLTPERLSEDGHGDRRDLLTGTGYRVGVETRVDSGAPAAC